MRMKKTKPKRFTDDALQSAPYAADKVACKPNALVLSAEDWSAFQAALDAPPRSLPRLERLARSVSVLD